MTKEELIAELKAISAKEDAGQGTDGRLYDQEDGHIEADNLLIAYINDPEVTDAFNEIGKWYS